jgi:hypothetical protein
LSIFFHIALRIFHEKIIRKLILYSRYDQNFGGENDLKEGRISSPKSENQGEYMWQPEHPDE